MLNRYGTHHINFTSYRRLPATRSIYSIIIYALPLTFTDNYFIISSTHQLSCYELNVRIITMVPPSSSCPSTHQAISPVQRGNGTWSENSLLALLDRPHQRASIVSHPVGVLSAPPSAQDSLYSRRQKSVDILDKALLISQDIEQGELWEERQ
jgi:hypothetical protein